MNLYQYTPRAEGVHVRAKQGNDPTLDDAFCRRLHGCVALERGVARGIYTDVAWGHQQLSIIPILTMRGTQHYQTTRMLDKSAPPFRIRHCHSIIKYGTGLDEIKNDSLKLAGVDSFFIAGRHLIQ